MIVGPLCYVEDVWQVIRQAEYPGPAIRPEIPRRLSWTVELSPVLNLDALRRNLVTGQP